MIRLKGKKKRNFFYQPYRTTPLVLPGAKAKHEKEMAPTGSYLKYHPNPGVRAGPSHYDFMPQEIAMKQKVADSILQKIEKDDALAGKQIIRQQFNTPIGLYSNKNIVDTIESTTRINTMAPRKAPVYDPLKSETFKALQEEEYKHLPVQEVLTPAQPKVFTPKKPVQSHTYNPLSHTSAQPNVQHHVPYVNSMGHSGEHIAQSGSFKRLMNMVLDDSNY
ncbi:conserved hypothetical protein [Pediculus humanus corporis]|uniref:Zasp-like motif domain-containing protein n=1 Tax=Pediculus humanus subsp. corporis TaxID=121224 RepID=E0VGI5_PEDHC|nr:uncharacterized protein Phum_PHUM183600 [Pediculus humanus corporis]EEB12491.1 conserved hypothetical protein [Pediculus humanus corporis]